MTPKTLATDSDKTSNPKEFVQSASPARSAIAPLFRLWAAPALIVGAMTKPAFAQERATAEGAPTSVCRVFALKSGAEEPKQLVASCRGRGLLLGHATEFSALNNVSLPATLIDVRLGTQRRVLLLTMDEDGVPLVQDLTGHIAMIAGRGATEDLAGLEIDVRDFVQTGTIAVADGGGGGATAQLKRVELAGPVLAARAARHAQPIAK